MIRAAARWSLVVGATVLVAYGLDQTGLPSASLFAAAGVGVAISLTIVDSPRLPGWAFAASQALTGIAIGVLVRPSALVGLGGSWFIVAAVSVTTLAFSVAVGRTLARVTAIDETTAVLGMVAGGASGIVGMSGALGADDRLVGFMQYLRVLVVVSTMPLVVTLVAQHGGGPAGAGDDTSGILGIGRDWWLTATVIPVGLLLGRLTRLPAGVLLGPMLAATTAVLMLPGGRFGVPPLLREPALAGIGLAVGLRFTRQTIRSLRATLVPVLLAVCALLLVCGGLGALIAATTEASALDGYLATTPGGLVAVFGVAFHTHADPTFVVAVQSLRLLGMTLVAPLLVPRADPPTPTQPIQGDRVLGTRRV